MTAAASAPERAALRRHPAGWIATGAGSGFSPVAPGTAGSLAALLPWLALRELALPYYVLALALAFAAGVAACGWAVRRLQRTDPGCVVWDEFVGLWLALTPLIWLHAGPLWSVPGFILFRLFDIAKPWPVSWADREVDGGLGVMLDDVLAGVYAAACLLILARWREIGCWLSGGTCG